MFKDYLTRQIERVLANSTIIRNIQRKLTTMATNQDNINEEVQELNDAFDGFATELEGQVSDLKSQIAAGKSVTVDDLSGFDALLAKIKAATAKDASTTDNGGDSDDQPQS